MHAKIITVDIGSNGHGFEETNEQLVNLLIVELLQDLRAESEVLSHGARLVISTQHDNVTRVVELETEEEDADFK